VLGGLGWRGCSVAVVVVAAEAVAEVATDVADE